MTIDQAELHMRAIIAINDQRAMEMGIEALEKMRGCDIMQCEGCEWEDGEHCRE